MVRQKILNHVERALVFGPGLADGLALSKGFDGGLLSPHGLAIRVKHVIFDHDHEQIG